MLGHRLRVTRACPGIVPHKSAGCQGVALNRTGYGKSLNSLHIKRYWDPMDSHWPSIDASLPANYPYAGKAVQRRFEAAEHQFAGPLSVGLSDIAEQGRGRDGRGRSPRRQAWDAPDLGTQKAFPHGIP